MSPEINLLDANSCDKIQGWESVMKAAKALEPIVKDVKANPKAAEEVRKALEETGK